MNKHLGVEGASNLALGGKAVSCFISHLIPILRSIKPFLHWRIRCTCFDSTVLLAVLVKRDPREGCACLIGHLLLSQNQVQLIYYLRYDYLHNSRLPSMKLARQHSTS